MTQAHEAKKWPQVRFGQVNILGVDVHKIDFPGVLSLLDAWIGPAPLKNPLQGYGIQDTGLGWHPGSRVLDAKDKHQPANCRQICTVNPEFIMDARKDPHFAAVLRRADLRAPDGVGIVLAARLLGVRLRERVTGSDGIYYICQHAATRGWRLFFLGAGPGVAEQTARKMQKLYPGLIVVGVFAGSPDDEDWPAIHHNLNEARPDILFVAYGHPSQDRWIDQHRQELPVQVAIGVGGAFDFVAGVTVRAPRWMQRLGLEWLHRLVRQPWRWRRMRKLPKFALLVLWQMLTGQR
jgi:N-acetylglucosaminyldiphosphoundecaprenol N-acetyl-beta-D-mannosaminyltransferase